MDNPSASGKSQRTLHISREYNINRYKHSTPVYKKHSQSHEMPLMSTSSSVHLTSVEDFAPFKYPLFNIPLFHITGVSFSPETTVIDNGMNGKLIRSLSLTRNKKKIPQTPSNYEINVN